MICFSEGKEKGKKESVIDWLTSMDTSLFYLLNVQLTHPWLDTVMPFITKFKHWIPVLIAWIVFMTYKDKKSGILFVVTAGLMILFSDQFCCSILKPLIGRLRPCIALEDIRLLASKKSTFSFPSGHATNTAAITFLGSLAFPYARKILFPIMFAIGYSRIYIGVHYPLDVLSGFILGAFIGFLFYRIFLIMNRIFKKKDGHAHIRN